MPWVRLHGIKDYLDMVEILEDFPSIHQTFNLVPCLIEQIQDYAAARAEDEYLRVSRKRTEELTAQEKDFILSNFFNANLQRMIMIFPR